MRSERYSSRTCRNSKTTLVLNGKMLSEDGKVENGSEHNDDWLTGHQHSGEVDHQIASAP